MRADQLLERLNKLRNQLVIETLLHRDDSPLSSAVWSKLRPEFAAATHDARRGLRRCGGATGWRRCARATRT